MLKVWYIDNNDNWVSSEETFKTLADAMAYASELEAKGLISPKCLEAEGARFVSTDRL